MYVTSGDTKIFWAIIPPRAALTLRYLFCDSESKQCAAYQSVLFDDHCIGYESSQSADTYF